MLLRVELKTLVVSWSCIYPFYMAARFFRSDLLPVAAAPQYIASPKSDVSVAGFEIDVEPCDLQIVEFLLSAHCAHWQATHRESTGPATPNQRQLHTSHTIRYA